MIFLAWLLVAWGFVVIVTTSRIFRGVRAWADRGGTPENPTTLGALLHCPLCFGFWVGLGLSLAGLASPSALACPSWWWPLRAWADGCAAAGACWCVHVVLVKLGANDL